MWRTGTKNPHTLYCDDEPEGFFIRPEAGRYLCDAVNAVERFKARYNELPPIPSMEQWKGIAVKLMGELESWPE